MGAQELLIGVGGAIIGGLAVYATVSGRLARLEEQVKQLKGMTARLLDAALVGRAVPRDSDPGESP